MPTADISTTRWTVGAAAINRVMILEESVSVSSPFRNRASASPMAAAQVASSYQSKRIGVTPGAGGPGVRLAARTEIPAAARAWVNRFPALPVAPSTHTVIAASVSVIAFGATLGWARRAPPTILLPCCINELDGLCRGRGIGVGGWLLRFLGVACEIRGIHSHRTAVFEVPVIIA